MARYWVGANNANWNATSSWASSSGGGSGASVPTSTDDVFFDANSGANVIAVLNVTGNCNSLDLSAWVSSSFLSLGDQTLNVNGNLALNGNAADCIQGATDANLNLKGTTKTITTNGGKIQMGGQVNDGLHIQGSYTLQDTWNFGLPLFIDSGGTLDNNGNAITTSAVTNNGTLKVKNTIIAIFSQIIANANSTTDLSGATITLTGAQVTLLGIASNVTSFVTNSSTFIKITRGGNTTSPGIFDLNGNTINELHLPYNVGFDDTYSNNQYIQFKSSGTITQLDIDAGVFMKGVAGIILTISNCNIVGTASLPCSLISETPGSTFNVCITNQNIKHLTVTKDVVWSCTAAIDIGGICSGGSCSNITFPPDVSPTAQAAALLLML